MADWEALKAASPRIPKDTCPAIDRLSTLVSAIDGDLELIREQMERSKSSTVRTLATEMLDTGANMSSVRLRLEELREENEALRASGRYWYGIAKQLAGES